MGLLDIKPHQVSRDLRGYSVMFYGAPKTGKTTTASQFPGALLFAFEKGYNALPGVMAQPINSWSEFKILLIELEDQAVQEKFQTIVIDTADIAYDYCTKYICNQQGVDSIDEIGYGKGWTKVKTEFDEGIRQILQLNYGLVLISHSTEKTEKDAAGKEYSRIVPTLDKRGRQICERTCDIIGYSTVIPTEQGDKTYLFMRGTPNFDAGSRFKYTPPYIEFSYENLTNAIANAIDKQAKESRGEYVTNERNQVVTQKIEYDFDHLMTTFAEITKKMMDENADNARKITAIVEKYLGREKKVGDCTPMQSEQLNLIVRDLKALQK